MAILGGGGSDGSSGVGAARGAAAREVHRRDMVERPAHCVKLVRHQLARINGSDATMRQDAVAALRETGAFGSNREGAMIATIFAHMWNKLEGGEPMQAQALCGAALAACDQWGRSNRLDTGYLWCHIPEPPASLSRSQPSSSLEPFTQMVPPMWTAATAAYLRDMELLENQLKKGPHRPKDPPTPKTAAEKAAAAEAAAKAKAARRKKEEDR